ncbi:MAG: hypothetical protein JWN48_577 [Myxococcaceae bacterium]|nr:hypothetical protein [Myxococcaceae bacterium]
MPNESGRAYGLTTLFPLCNDSEDDQSFAAVVRGHLRALAVDESSPMAKVPNTYLCRMFVLDDVFYEGKPAAEEHLRSKYLVFVAELHGDLDTYLRGMWTHAEETIRRIWHYCVAFQHVDSADDFVRYVKKCQVETTFYFNGSNDDPLAEQLKALYLKQELAKFVHEHQGVDAASLQAAFRQFVERTQPKNLASPTWRPGASSLELAVIGAST